MTTNGETAAGRPLDGVRILDMTRVVAGPFCGRLLADLGADVVKIEPPRPDLTRNVRPIVEGTSPYFAQLNAGKRAMTVDLTVPEGCTLVRRLAAGADVLIENFRPGVLARFGLGADSLLEENQALVYCSISGYGQSGPWSRRRAFAPAIHAEAALLDIVARRTHAAPRPAAQSHADTYAGCLAATAIVTALYERTRTGRGQHLDVSLAEASLYTNEWIGLELAGGDDADWFGPTNTLVVELADGTWAATVGHPALLFPRWTQAMGRSDLLDDPALATNDARLEHRDVIEGHIRAFVRTIDDFETLEAVVDPHGLVVGRVRTVDELAVSEWAEHRDVFADVAPGVATTRRPWRSSTAQIGTVGGVAGVGEHNADVCRSYGISEAEIAALLAAGALR